MSSIVTYIEEICKQKQIEIPALIQLRAAKNKNDYESVERIAKNIISYLEVEQDIKLFNKL